MYLPTPKHSGPVETATRRQPPRLHKALPSSTLTEHFGKSEDVLMKEDEGAGGLTMSGKIFEAVSSEDEFETHGPLPGAPLYRTYVDGLPDISRKKGSGLSSIKTDSSLENRDQRCNQVNYRQRGKMDSGMSTDGLRGDSTILTYRNKGIDDFTGSELHSVNFSRQVPSAFGLLKVGNPTEALSSFFSTPNFGLMGRRGSDDFCQFKRRGSFLNSPPSPVSPSPHPPSFPPPLLLAPSAMGKNPNKAILTVCGTSNKILIANTTACSLFSLDYKEMVGRTLESLCQGQEGEGEEESTPPVLMGINSILTKDGQLVPSHGNIIDIISSSGSRIPVSLWVYPLKTSSASVSGSAASVASSVPTARFSESLPASVLRRQKDNSNLGRSFNASASMDEESPRYLVLMEPVEVHSAACVLGPKGRIFRADDELAVIFGYNSSSDLLGMDVDDLIPALHVDIGHVTSTSSLTAENAPSTSEKPATTCLFEKKSYFFTGKRKRKTDDAFPLKLSLDATYDEDGSVLKYDVKVRVYLTISGVVTVLPNGNLHSFNTNFVQSLLGYNQDELSGKPVTSVLPDFLHHTLDDESPGFDNSFGCGSELSKSRIGPAVVYQVRRLVLKEEDVLYCVWISWDSEFDDPNVTPDEPPEEEITTKQAAYREEFRRSFSNSEADYAEIIGGPYSDAYYTLHQIGKGAFGAVKLAARRCDRLLVITKFMKKSKILTDSWIMNEKLRKKIPIEIHILTTFQHRNIVQVLDVFENDTFYQMVMEKHGCGMDLFDFIDRQPILDEPLISYMFRQIVSAVSFLHSNGIVHRDVKDENVIVNEKFCCKLIDFGSAAYFKPDKLFSTFCGTMEYCSPEVLLGNKYKGPELEMWSLGILLYTLAFFENPFSSPQETIEGMYDFPFDISEGLTNLLGFMLYPDPNERAEIKDAERHWWVKQKVDPTRYSFRCVLPLCEVSEWDPPVYCSEIPTNNKGQPQ